MKRTRQRLLYAGTFLALTSLTSWAGFFAGRYLSEQKWQRKGIAAMHEQDAVYRLNQSLVKFKELPPSLQAKIREYELKKAEEYFLADYNYYRGLEALIKAHAVSEFVASEGKRLNREPAELQKEWMPIQPAGDTEAESLFQASDPNAERKDFEALKPKLKEYIDEISKREAFDKFYQKLVKEGKVALFLSRPERTSVQIAVDKFPAVGQSNDTLVVSFVDYLCENCAEYNVSISQLAQKYSSKAKFVFIPFPYSRPDRAMAIARGALCAHQLNMYLDYHMAAVSLGTEAEKVGPLALAQKANLPLLDFALCYGKGEGIADLLQSVQHQANRAGVLSTPVSYLNGKRLEGDSGVKQLELSLKEKFGF